MTRPRVTCYGDVDLVHAAHPVTGLIELADAGEIDLRFRFQDRSVPGFRGAWTLWLRVEAEQVNASVAIDVHDGAEYLSEASLKACQLYFKVNLSEQTFTRAPLALHDRLRPYGPYFPCRPRRDRALALRWAANLAVKAQHRFLHATKPMSAYAKVRDVARELKRHRRYLSRKTWNEYEADRTNVAALESSKILFNPTCWDEASGDAVRAVNEFRANLIIALRNEFGARFVGGFRNSGPSVHRYPDAVEDRPISHDEYVRYLHASPIVVYSNGNSNCFSWRLAEAFAASQCIVSEVIPNSADVPLDDRVGCLQCPDIAEMVATLRRLLDDRDAVTEYSRRAYRYYVERIRPAARMRRVLDDVLQCRPLEAAVAAAART